MCEIWSLTLREERRQRVFDNRVLRRVFGSVRTVPTTSVCGFGCQYFNHLIDFHKYWYEYCHCITLRSRGKFIVKLMKLRLQGPSLTWPPSKALGGVLTKPQKCLEILKFR